jgi:hypothetical protein
MRWLVLIIKPVLSNRLTSIEAVPAGYEAVYGKRSTRRYQIQLNRVHSGLYGEIRQRTEADFDQG